MLDMCFVDALTCIGNMLFHFVVNIAAAFDIVDMFKLYVLMWVYQCKLLRQALQWCIFEIMKH